MPVEIKELVIKVVVDEAGGKGNAGKNEHEEGSPEMLVRACVEKVLEILKDQRER
ncbi:MAG TPA: DUF5908 family protein [Chitinophaga sp.]|uniref:DUF5908 family protein n=1 Tax=Chitinophaga sp. TaxID=1869181 RepID=UPI002CDE2A2F|nr:DUF5908 family protein [Chitinophaga sp.]HVI44767.1 DUF5908 family protein [Chitinophaga sp.]